MDQMDYKEKLEALRRAGFTGPELKRLYQLRRTYVETEQDRAPADFSRLQFIRWLAMNGKLTEHLTENNSSQRNCIRGETN